MDLRIWPIEAQVLRFHAVNPGIGSGHFARDCNAYVFIIPPEGCEEFFSMASYVCRSVLVKSTGLSELNCLFLVQSLKSGPRQER